MRVIFLNLVLEQFQYLRSGSFRRLIPTRGHIIYGAVLLYRLAYIKNKSKEPKKSLNIP